MKKPAFRSIQTSIFLRTTLLVVGVICSAVLFYLLTTVQSLRSNYIKSSNQLAKILSSRLDDTVRQADSLQMRILESNSFREYVFGDFTDRPGNNRFTKQSSFEKEMFTIVGYDLPFYHLSVYTIEGVLLQFGRIYSFATDVPLSFKQHQVMQNSMALRGYKYLESLHQAKLYEESPSVAISRAFSRFPLNDPKAVIEIQVAYSTLENLLHSHLLSYDNNASKVLIYDEDNQLVHPQDTPEDILIHYINATPDKQSSAPSTGEKELVSRYTSGYTGWTVCLVTPYAALTTGFDQYVMGAGLVGLTAVLLAMLIAFEVAKKISAPLVAIKETLLSVNLATLNRDETEIKTNYNELDLLQKSVKEMQQKLDSSLQDYVSMRSLSIQSRMTALQSQMNPHFLYNTLSIMAILAEENKDREVSQMCHKLVGMLRYISTEREVTTLQQELEHTKLYADLIRIRFGNKINIEYDIDPALLDILLPPIILQPLIENSVKYARTDSALLSIYVRVFQKEDYWYIHIRDNGNGFSDEALQTLWEKVGKKSDWEKILRHEVEGVGLANIYLRLQLLYESSFVFEITNGQEGANILVGGNRTQQ